MGTETGRKWRGGRKGERFHLAWRENRWKTQIWPIRDFFGGRVVLNPLCPSLRQIWRDLVQLICFSSPNFSLAVYIVVPSGTKKIRPNFELLGLRGEKPLKYRSTWSFLSRAHSLTPAPTRAKLGMRYCILPCQILPWSAVHAVTTAMLSPQPREKLQIWPYCEPWGSGVSRIWCEGAQNYMKFLSHIKWCEIVGLHWTRSM